MNNRQINSAKTTFRQVRPSSGRSEFARFDGTPRHYDIRVVDQFYRYCQAVARTDRHRDEAYARLHGALKRSVWSMLVCASLLFYYTMDRAAQAMALF